MKRDVDSISGQETTGHEWDGIKELDTPIPKSLMLWLYLSIAVCVVMWILYPAWPFVSGYTKGIAGYSSRAVVTDQVADGQALREHSFDVFAKNDIATLAQDATLKEKFLVPTSVLYRDNCLACHGRDLQGQTGFPNLTDDHWLWSGTPEGIETTLTHGINHVSDDTQFGQMPAFGRDEILEEPDIDAVVEYVLQISGQDHDAKQATLGAEVFAENCASCHEEAGKGGMENGAPSLSDAAWIYGAARKDLHKTIYYGRAGVMPGWTDRLSDAEIKMLTLYVLWSGQNDQGE